MKLGAIIPLCLAFGYLMAQSPSPVEQPKKGYVPLYSWFENMKPYAARFQVFKGHPFPVRTVVLRYKGLTRTAPGMARVSFASDPIDMDIKLPKVLSKDFAWNKFDIRFFFILKVNDENFSTTKESLSTMQKPFGAFDQPYTDWNVGMGDVWQISCDLMLDRVQESVAEIATMNGELQEAMVECNAMYKDKAFRILMPAKDQVRLWDDLVQIANTHVKETRIGKK
jgi:hypothetical protein